MITPNSARERITNQSSPPQSTANNTGVYDTINKYIFILKY